MDRSNLSNNLVRSRFTRSFLQALKKINNEKTTTSSSPFTTSPKEVYGRYRRVKSAADKSLALAVRSRRVIWRRALLWRLKKQYYYSSTRLRARIKTRGILIKKKNNNYLSSSDELRRLVPGGEGMDLCSLLKETAHYMKCLNTQVQVMTSVLDLYTTI
ncbi:hypothetical protein ACFE04_002521 [Oxalis oulophora]